jgi:poly(beta-D-mannuronate) lyase
MKENWMNHGMLCKALALSLAVPGLGRSAEHQVSSASDVTRRALAAQPGDVLVMSNGVWQDQAITFTARGTAKKPITLRAESPGKVVLTGRSSVVIDGEHLVVQGLSLRHGALAGDGIKLAGRNSRLTECAVVGGSYKFFVHLFGTSNRVDHCYLAGKTNDSPTLQIEVEGRPNFHQLDHNHFGPRPPLGRNGGETIRVGYSQQSMTNSITLVERNLFDRCDGEFVIISSKSGGNIYRFNTFVDCAGMLTLRHGNQCVVEGNWFLGRGKNGSGGIRVIGEDHIVINNYIESVDKGGIWITAGIPDSELKGYFQSRNCLIAFNTIVDSRAAAIELDTGFGTSRRTLRPENITIVNNLFLPPANGILLKGQAGEGFRWGGNLTSPHARDRHESIRPVDLAMRRDNHGVWRPAADGPTRGTALGTFSVVKADIDGQPRRRPFDVGCDQISDAPVHNPPLNASDVGPSWMNHRVLE